jgi:orotidine-5'-phosphate decarboxylase
MSLAAKDRLIVALDVDNLKRARELVSALRDLTGMFKVGLQLFTALGPNIVREIVEGGGRVFLDLKFHDIPNTVAGAAAEATRLGVSLFNVHAAGGAEMMRRAVDATAEVAMREGIQRPRVLAVTALTSTNEHVLSDTGVTGTVEDTVIRLARLAEASTLDGVVASPREVRLIRAAVLQSEFLVVTPGVRPAGASLFDQKRVMTPAEAVQAGADYLVIGRPIIEASDPRQAAQLVIDDMESAGAADLIQSNRNSP